MNQQRNIHASHPLLEYDGEILVTLFPEERYVCYCLSDQGDTHLWAVLDCSGQAMILSAYLMGKATLRQLYEAAPRHCELELASGEFVPQEEAVDEAPAEESLLYYPDPEAFALTFPGINPAEVSQHCDREDLLQRAVQRYFPESNAPTEIPPTTFESYRRPCLPAIMRAETECVVFSVRRQFPVTWLPFPSYRAENHWERYIQSKQPAQDASVLEQYAPLTTVLYEGYCNV